MRYEDASLSGSFQDQGLNARDDADQLAAGDRGPATGNVISGAGTETGASGADAAAAGARVVAVAGAGGNDSSFEGGRLRVEGEHGTLSLTARGDYSYTAKPGVPENSRDTFTYTLSDASGATSQARLMIEIGKTQAVVKADAQRVVPGPDGVVVLPAGVELSDIRIVGRDLLIMLPDGSQMLIVDGAVFVPQLVINDIEVPSTNLAALLIEQEPRPASGVPQSSGGNFIEPVGPLDPGTPLGDLLPPTQLPYTPPEFNEVAIEEDREPEVGPNPVVQIDDDARPGGNAGGTGDDPDSVNATGTLSGSGGDGPLTFAFNTAGAPTGFTYSVNAQGALIVSQGQTVVLTVTLNAQTGAYVVTQNAPIQHSAGDNENNITFTFNYTVTDRDGDSAAGTLQVNVDDDTPTIAVSAGADAGVTLTTDDVDTRGELSDNASSSANFGGVFSLAQSVGADGLGTAGSLTYALGTPGGASGLTQGGVAINLYLVGGKVVGSTATSAAGITAGNTVFDASVSSTGVVTLTQYSQIDHSNTDPTPGDSPFADHIISLADGLVTLTASATITDRDGDSASSSQQIQIGSNLRFTDDGPSLTGAEGGAGVTLDETNAAIPGFPISQTSASAVIVGTGVNYGADGQAASGAATYSINVVGGGATPLKTAQGDFPITLVQTSPTVITGTYDGGKVAFTVTINANGSITVSQSVPLEHNVDGTTAAAFDDSLDLAGLINATVVIKDFDGDTASASTAIGNLIVFKDDGPDSSLNLDVARPTLVLDETRPVGSDTSGAGAPSGLASVTVGFAANFAAVKYGADGAGSTAYSLVLNGENVASGMYALQVGDTSAVDGDPIGRGAEIVLNQVGNVITGSVGDVPYFTITIDPATGAVTFAQLQPVWNPSGGSSYDEAAVLNAVQGSIAVRQTVTDSDGDSDSNDLDISSGVFQIQDDGPSLNVTQSGEAAVLLTTQDAETRGSASDTAQTSSGNFANVFGATSTAGADGASAPSLSFGLNVLALNSGLTSHGATVNLYKVGDIVVGTTGGQPANLSDPSIVFTVEVNSAGTVKLTQYQQIDHQVEGPPGATNSPFDDQYAILADGKISLTASGTLTDTDGDVATDSETIDLGGNLRFADDGPAISAGSAPEALVVSDADLATNDSGSFAGLFNFDFGADGAAASGSVTYALSVTAGPTGMFDTATKLPVTLVKVNDPNSPAFGSVVGIIQTAPGVFVPVFVVSVNATTGEVTLNQIRPVYHSTSDSAATGDSDVPETLLSNDSIQLTATIKDYDGDTASQTVGIGNLLTFQDDFPSIEIGATDDVENFLITQDADTIGAATDTVTSGEAFNGAFFLISENFGGDGEGSSDLYNDADWSLALQVAEGANSGLTSGGVAIKLYINADGKVIGSTALTEGAINDANTIFTLAVDGEGAVTLSQLQQIDHPIASDPSATGPGFDDHVISLPNGLVRLNVTATAVDGDQDVAQDSAFIDLGGNIRFADHGPDAVNDSTSVTEGAAIGGNVLNNDAPGADGYAPSPNGTVIGIASVNQTTSDATADGSGNFVLAGQYGTLTVNRDGTYSYQAFPNSNPTQPDVFTYTIRDFDGDTDTATLTINVNNVTLVATDSDAIVNEAGLPVVGSNAPSNSEIDSDGVISISGGTGPYTFTLNGSPTGAYGTLTLNSATGEYTYTLTSPYDTSPDNNNGTNTEQDRESFSYTVTDANGNTTTGTILVDIIDDVPSLSAVTYAAIASGDETSGFPLTIETAGAVIDATKVFGADGAAATGSIAYTIGVPGAATSVLTSLTTAQGNFQITIKEVSSTVLQGVYQNGGEQVAFTISINPTTGKVTYVQNVPLNHPTDGSDAAAFNDTLTPLTLDGYVSAVLTIKDGDGDTASTGELNVGNLIKIFDDGPTAVADSANVSEGASVSGNVITNDLPVSKDGWNEPKITGVVNTAAGTSDATLNGADNYVIQGLYGTLTLNKDGSYTYQSTANAITKAEVDVFTYTIKDADGDTTTANLTINLANANLVATDSDAIVNEAGLPIIGSDAASNSEIDSDGVISVVGGTGPYTFALNGSATGAYGTLTLNSATGEYTYTLTSPYDTSPDNNNGTNTEQDRDSFSYTVTDANGNTTTGTILVDIIDDVPTAVNDADSVTEDGPLVATGNVITGDDVLVSPDANGTDGVEDVPGADGIAGVTAIVFNGSGGNVAGTVGSALAGQYGSLTLNANGSYSYTLNNAAVQSLGAGQTRTETFTYTIVDNDGDTDTATLTITINGTNDNPVANPDTHWVLDVVAGPAPTASGNVLQNQSHPGDPSISLEFADVADTDVDAGDVLTVTTTGGALVGSGGYGTLNLAANGTYTYTLNANNAAVNALDEGETLTDTFNYSVSDGKGGTANATLTITIFGTNDVPTIGNATARISEEGIALIGNPDGVGSPDDQTNNASFSGTVQANDPDGFDDIVAVTFGTPSALSVKGQAVVWTGTGTGTVIGSVGGVEIIKLEITGYNAANGQASYTVTILNAGIDHAGINIEDLATFTVPLNVSDGTTNVLGGGTLTVTVEDDSPVAFTPDPVASLTGDQPPVIGSLNLDMGADGLNTTNPLVFDLGSNGSAILNNGTIAKDQAGNTLMVNGATLYLHGDNTNQIFATTTLDGSGAKAFTVTLNADGTYTFDVNAVISNGTQTSFTNLTSAAAGNVDFRGVGANDGANNSGNIDVLLSGQNAAGTAITINTSSTSIGSGNQSIGGGETIRIDLVNNLTSPAVTATGFNFNTYAGTTQYTQTIPQVNGQPGTVTINVAAVFEATQDQGFGYYFNGTPLEAGETLREITSVTIFDNVKVGNGSAAVGSVTVADPGNNTPVIVQASNGGASYTVTFNTDGTVTIAGLGAADQYSINTGQEFNTVLVNSPVSNNATFDLGIFTIGTFSAGVPIDQNFPVIATDGDGDTAVGVVQTTIVANVTGNSVGDVSANAINGTASDNALAGNAGNDTINGLGGNDYVYGGAGNDTLLGGDGNDVLEGGTGADNLTGGAGNDTFVLSNAAITANSGNVDTITDYAAGDVVDITEILSITGASDAASFVRLLADGQLQVDIDGAGNSASFVTVANLSNLPASVSVKYDLSDGATATVPVASQPVPLLAPLTSSLRTADTSTTMFAGLAAAVGMMSEPLAAEPLEPKGGPKVKEESFQAKEAGNQKLVDDTGSDDGLSLLSQDAAGNVGDVSGESAEPMHRFANDPGLVDFVDPAAVFAENAGFVGDAGTSLPAQAAQPALIMAGGEVLLPSAEQMMALAGPAAESIQRNPALEQVLSDALSGGGGEGIGIDRLIEAAVKMAEPKQHQPGREIAEAATGADGGDAHIPQLASQLGNAVPGWDAGHFSALFHGAATAMDAATLHPDAVQPATNG